MKAAAPRPGRRIRTVDALRVGDRPGGAQGVVVLLVAHQRVHSQDRCEHRELSQASGSGIGFYSTSAARAA